MDRIIEERQVSQHKVAIIEEVMDEGVGYSIMIDGVLIVEAEPLDHMPADEEIADIMDTHGFR